MYDLWSHGVVASCPIRLRELVATRVHRVSSSLFTGNDIPCSHGVSLQCWKVLSSRLRGDGCTGCSGIRPSDCAWCQSLCLPRTHKRLSLLCLLNNKHCFIYSYINQSVDRCVFPFFNLVLYTRDVSFPTISLSAGNVKWDSREWDQFERLERFQRPEKWYDRD